MRLNRIPEKRIKLREFGKEEKLRIHEVIFYMIIKNIMQSNVASSSPMGTTLPIMLANILEVNSGVIDYSWNTLNNYPINTPTTTEMVLAQKLGKVAALKSTYTADTYYKHLNLYVDGGEWILKPKLSLAQHNMIKRFNKRYTKAFLGKRYAVSKMLQITYG